MISGATGLLSVPVFLAGDGSTMPLRAPRSTPHHLRLSRRNLGPTPEILDGIVERIDELHQKHGRSMSSGEPGRRCSRVGPGCAHTVRQVITMGSPFQIETPADSNEPALPGAPTPPRPTPRAGCRPMCATTSVPTTSIYTADGVVRWADCLNHDTETRRTSRSTAATAPASTSPHSSWWPTDSPNRSSMATISGASITARPLPGRTDLPGSCRTCQRLRRRPGSPGVPPGSPRQVAEPSGQLGAIAELFKRLGVASASLAIGRPTITSRTASSVILPLRVRGCR